MNDISRRNLIIAGAATLLSTQACAQDETAAQSLISYTPQPLPFDPKAINGLSEKLLKSHHARNYSGAVKRLGVIQTQLAGMDYQAAKGFTLNGLKREELMALNSMILHEVYFAGFNDEKRPIDTLGQQIENDFGSLDSWATEFSALGRAQGGGSGWVLLSWSPRLGRLLNSWSADHTHTGADAVILMALDMYEHAYAMDYGANAGAYVKAYMRATGWAYANTVYNAIRR